MKISCNRLKKYIKNSDSIDFVKVWDTFAIRTAEVEQVEIKGNDIRGVVVVEVTKFEKHPTKDNYSVLEVSDGSNIYSVLCGAPNVKLGMKAFLVKVGGMVQGFEIAEKKIAGVLSQGMLCAGDELGLNDDHDGIIELPMDTKLGLELQEVYPFVNDVVIEIDNKSLTNRPDLWGHYGIAREIAAITDNELLPLELYEFKNDKEDLSIDIKSDMCFRYCGLTVDNIKNNVTPMEMQVFLKYVGLRSLSLIVDLTNFVMLELGQPMHAFDKRSVKSILVDMAKDGEEFTTLDGKTRTLNKDVLLIKNENENFAIAGIMGGLDSEIKEDTDSIFLEGATFDSGCIRKSATFLGHRTDASMRYEKSLDPEMCELAIKRFVYLLSLENEELIVSSNFSDCYKKKYNKIKVELKKNKLTKYMGFVLDDEIVVNILTKLNFIVEVTDESYIVSVPTNRATKDVSIDADIIEEVSRMYGYENIEEKALNTISEFAKDEHVNEEEYNVKSFLTRRFNASEVHSYLWYDSSFLKENGLDVNNVTVINKTDNNILRNNLSLSLLPFVRNNFKNYNDFIIYEIGTVIRNEENCRNLSIILAGGSNDAMDIYNKAKKIVVELFDNIKHEDVKFIKTTNDVYGTENYALDIICVDNVIGNINVVSPKISYNLGKKKFVVTIEILFDEFVLLNKKDIYLEEKSKYQETELDYTIIMDSKLSYDKLQDVLNTYSNEYLSDAKLVDVYNDGDVKKYSVRFTASSKDKTLDANDLKNIKDTFIDHIEKNGLEIVK